MKVIVSGSRSYNDKNIVWESIEESGFKPITSVLSGHARGVDLLGEEWARLKKIPIELYIPHYKVDNPKIAPLLRNVSMAQDGDALVAIWYKQSHGTEHMINQMKSLNKPVYIVEVNDFGIVKRYYNNA